jgi:hypothetical protein
MSDKPLPITLTGTYKGYQVSVQVEATLDSLDKLVARLQARGVEPLPTAPAPAPASKGSGSKQKGSETLEGTVKRILTDKALGGKAMHLFKFEVDDGSGDPVHMPCVMFGPDAIYAAERVKPGQYIRLEGYTKHDESWGASFQVQKIIEIRKAAA